jgi:hypothetical protein
MDGLPDDAIGAHNLATVGSFNAVPEAVLTVE